MKSLIPSVIIAFLLAIVPRVALSDTNIWQGKSASNSTAWEASENWSTGEAPAQDDGNDIVIPGGVASYPKLSGDVVIGGSLTVETGATLTLAGHNVSLGSLPVDNKKGVTIKGTLDATGGPSSIAVGRGGFTNAGKILGAPALAFGIGGYCHEAKLTAGGASFSSLTLGEGSYSYPVTLMDNLTVEGDVRISGNTLIVSPKATLTIRKDLVFEGKAQNAGLTPSGPVLVHGTITSNGSALCRGAGYDDQWVTLAGKGDQIIKPGGVLPSIKVAKSSGKAILAGDGVGCGLWIARGNTVDCSGVRQLQFGAPSCYCARGFINEGTLVGEVAIAFASGAFQGALLPGTAKLTGLTVDTGHYAYYVILDSDVTVTGDVTFKTGQINLNGHTLTVGGSLRMPPFVPTASSVLLVPGKDGRVIFNTSSSAILEAGEVRADHHSATSFNHLVVDKPGGVLKLKSDVVVNGNFEVKSGTVTGEGNVAVWLNVQRDGDRIIDVPLKLAPPLTPDDLAPLITGHEVGPQIPAGVKLVNIAPVAAIRSVPYTTMMHLLVDPDPQLRTFSTPEAGLPIKGERYEFHFAKPQTIAAVRWSVPNGKWAILADSTGNGVYDKVLRADLAGKIQNPGGTWVSRAWVRNSFWPPVKACGVAIVNPDDKMCLYDVRILSPADEVSLDLSAPKLESGVPVAESADTLTVPDPPAARQFTKGYHIEDWMFGLNAWLNLKPRPPLTEYVGFKNFVSEVKRTHANYVNLWPSRNIEVPQGDGTYEADVLWPSRYELHSMSENVLKEISDAFQKNGIMFFTMDRVIYPKKPGEFPETKTSKLPAPYIPRSVREHIQGFAAEQTSAGVNGVGVGFDEQAYSMQVPDDFTKKVFKERHQVDYPEKPADTEAYRKWLLFTYEEFGNYLQGAAAAAKAANPKVITNSPITTLDTAWNNRIDWGVAHDVVGHIADIDVLRASGYEDSANLGHYVTAANVKRVIGATKSRGAIALHNCPWANDPEKFPGYYLHFPPSWMYGPPISAFMNGAKIAAYWRQNFIYYGGYDKHVEQAFALLDTLAAWGMKDAGSPRAIAVLRSRASEDWWQVRQRYNKDGDPMDQTRGFLYEKWLLEFLLTRGYPFDMYYLDYPQDLKHLSDYAVAILPFPYSLKQEALQPIESAMRKGTKVIVLDRKGETDEFGAPHPKPLLADWIAKGQVSFIGDDLPAVGHYPEVQEKMRKLTDSLLGARKPLDLNTYGNDVEVAMLEKGLQEKFVSAINWTDHPVRIDLGVNNLPAGKYQVLQRDLTGARKVKIGGKDILTPADLRKFRLALDNGAVKVLWVHPAGK